MFKRVICGALLLIGLVSNQASAGLIVNGDGTITQTRSDGTVLMWTQDANLAFTSGFYPWDNGEMTWQNATDWADQLTFAGHDDWRLPTALDPDGTSCAGLDCTLSELGNIYFVELGNVAGDTTLNYGPFLNVQDRYWLSTETLGRNGLLINAYNFWFFDPIVERNHQFSGFQEGGRNKVLSRFNAWAVREVGVTNGVSVPEPETFGIFSVGLLGMGLLSRRRRRKILRLRKFVC